MKCGSSLYHPPVNLQVSVQRRNVSILLKKPWVHDSLDSLDLHYFSVSICRNLAPLHSSFSCSFKFLLTAWYNSAPQDSADTQAKHLVCPEEIQQRLLKIVCLIITVPLFWGLHRESLRKRGNKSIERENLTFLRTPLHLLRLQAHNSVSEQNETWGGKTPRSRKQRRTMDTRNFTDLSHSALLFIQNWCATPECNFSPWGMI